MTSSFLCQLLCHTLACRCCRSRESTENPCRLLRKARRRGVRRRERPRVRKTGRTEAQGPICMKHYKKTEGEIPWLAFRLRLGRGLAGGGEGLGWGCRTGVAVTEGNPAPMLSPALLGNRCSESVVVSLQAEMPCQGRVLGALCCPPGSVLLIPWEEPPATPLSPGSSSVCRAGWGPVECAVTSRDE